MTYITFYRHSDYIGVFRRLLIDIIDTTLVVIASLIVTALALAVVPEPMSYFAILAGCMLIWFAYFVILKHHARTLGYILTGARIVNGRGERPSYIALTGRLAFALFGPVNFLLDLLWVSSDPCGQAMRDKFAHTYVVKNTAVPAGQALAVYRVYTVFGATLMFPEAREMG